MRRTRVVLVVLAALLMLSLALGLTHPFGNPRATTIAATDAPSTMLLEHALVPVEVRSVLREKCSDCHSDQTRWPWYGRFGPVSWLLEYDITEAHEQMNLSQWEGLSDEEIRRLRVEIAGVTRAHAMPPWRYRLLYSDATVTDDDVKILKDWARGDVPKRESGRIPKVVSQSMRFKGRGEMPDAEKENSNALSPNEFELPHRTPRCWGPRVKSANDLVVGTVFAVGMRAI